MQAFICAIYSFRGLHSNYYNITIQLFMILGLVNSINVPKELSISRAPGP